MIKKEKNDFVWYQFEKLALRPDIFHCITTRKGGTSTGTYESLNLSFNTGDERENVKKNREKLAAAAGIKPECLIFPRQVHGDTIKTIPADFFTLSPAGREHLLEQTDALVTDVKGLCIGVLAADCVPLLLYDPVRKVVAAVHAGWKGTTAFIAAKTVFYMKERFQCNPSEIIAGIGPSISPDVYEVGTEVVECFQKQYGKEERKKIILQKDAHFYLNLWEANRIQLLQQGILPDHIEIAGLCTYQNPSLFYSARRSGMRTGRFAAGIMIKN